jgi:hypothetical protein
MSSGRGPNGNMLELLFIVVGILGVVDVSVVEISQQEHDERYISVEISLVVHSGL